VWFIQHNVLSHRDMLWQDGDGMPGVLRGVLERLPYPIAIDLAALAGRLYRQQLTDLSAWFAERISSQV